MSGEAKRDPRAWLRSRAEEARARLEAGAAAGDWRAQKALRELAGTEAEVQVDPVVPLAVPATRAGTGLGGARGPGEGTGGPPAGNVAPGPNQAATGAVPHWQEEAEERPEPGWDG